MMHPVGQLASRLEPQLPEDLYVEREGDGVPILLVHPAGATASTWGELVPLLAQTGQVIVYDRRGYGRSGGPPAGSIPTHSGDAAALLEGLCAEPAVVVGTSIGATIAIDVALSRPDLVRAVVAHESPWRVMRHVPTPAAMAALIRMRWLWRRGNEPDAVETFLRFAYSYRDGGTAWDAFPEDWRRAARENAKPALIDIRTAVGGYPPSKALATVRCPVVCSHGSRSNAPMAAIARSLAGAMPHAEALEIHGVGHAAPFDSPEVFARVVASACESV